MSVGGAGVSVGVGKELVGGAGVSDGGYTVAVAPGFSGFAWVFVGDGKGDRLGVFVGVLVGVWPGVMVVVGVGVRNSIGVFVTLCVMVGGIALAATALI